MVLFVIDPGHGGGDTGATGRESVEKDNVLVVAKRLQTLLENEGHTVILTRSDDSELTLSQRANIANQENADYFISLHNNADPSSASVRGFETYTFDGNVRSTTRIFQSVVHRIIASKIDTENRGEKRANFAVLRETNMSALLIEYAFITNKEDEKILIDEANELAQWTCEGIIQAVGSSKPKKPKANLNVDGYWGRKTTKALQEYFGTPADGEIWGQYNTSTTRQITSGMVYGPPYTGSKVIRALQSYVNAKVDGLLGPETVTKFQQHLGTPVDGEIWKPSAMVKEMQRRLNKGDL